MLIAVMVDGQLRMYDQEGRQLEEWARLSLKRAMDHEGIAQLAADLAVVVGANGHAAGLVDARVVEAPQPAALPAAPHRGKGTGPAEVQLTNSDSYRDVERVLGITGPMAVGELSQLTGMAGPSLSSRLAKLRQHHLAQFRDGKWHLVRRGMASTLPQPAKRPVGRPKGSKSPRRTDIAWGTVQVLSLIRSEPGISRDELQARTGLTRQNVNNRLWSLRDKGAGTLANTVRIDADGRVWPLEAPEPAAAEAVAS